VQKTSQAVAEMDLEDLDEQAEPNELQDMDGQDATDETETDDDPVTELVDDDGHDDGAGQAADVKPTYQHVTAVRCPRCNTIMRANGTRMVTKDGAKKQVKRWVCPCAVCRRTHETEGVEI